MKDRCTDFAGDLVEPHAATWVGGQQGAGVLGDAPVLVFRAGAPSPRGSVPRGVLPKHTANEPH